MAIKNLLVTCLSVAAFCSLANSYSKGAIEQLTESYDPATRPNASTPLKVGISIAVEHVKWHHGLLSVSVFPRQKWNDPRFVRKSGVTRFNSDHSYGHIWDPDFYFWNTWDPPAILNAGLQDIQHNGDVTFSKQLQFQVYCKMDVEYAYLNDGKVKCNIRMGSFTYDASELVLHWLEDQPSFSGRFQNVSSVKTSVSMEKYSIGTWSVATLEMDVHTNINRPAIQYLDAQEYDIQ